jgi:hypothetical protein
MQPEKQLVYLLFNSISFSVWSKNPISDKIQSSSSWLNRNKFPNFQFGLSRIGTL